MDVGESSDSVELLFVIIYRVQMSFHEDLVVVKTHVKVTTTDLRCPETKKTVF